MAAEREKLFLQLPGDIPMRTGVRAGQPDRMGGQPIRIEQRINAMCREAAGFTMRTNGLHDGDTDRLTVCDARVGRLEEEA